MPLNVSHHVSRQAAAQKTLDTDSMMSPDPSSFALPLDNGEERRRSQGLLGLADMEGNLSEEKLLQVDTPDGGKVSTVSRTLLFTLTDSERAVRPSACWLIKC